MRDVMRWVGEYKRLREWGALGRTDCFIGQSRYTVNADVNAVFNQHFLYLSHLLHGGGKARSMVRVGISLKGLPTRRRNLSGVPKATATHVY